MLSKKVLELNDFNDTQKAAIVYNTEEFLENRNEKLKEILNSTIDTELKEQISFVIDLENTIYKNMFKPNNRFYLYSRFLGNAYLCFNSFEEALEKIKELNTDYPFSIERVSNFSSINEPNAGVFIKDNKITRVWSNSLRIPENYFTDNFIDFKHPFKRGDVVKNINTGNIMVVEDAEYPNNTNGLDFIDSTIMVEILDDDKKFHHEHVLPIFLDFEPNPPEIYKKAGLLLKNQTTLDDFTHSF